MLRRVRSPWVTASQSLGFIPGAIVVLFAILGVVLVEIDGHVDLDGVQFVFRGTDRQRARCCP
jgi:hypothetical protein